MMEKAIQDFPKQFVFEPVIQNPNAFPQGGPYAIGGMGGSALPARLLRVARPGLAFAAHSDYGFPEGSYRAAIAISYSGNTEETLSFFEEAKKRNIPVAVIAVGGELLRRAVAEKISHVVLPDTGIQPRMAIGFIIRALLALMGDTKGLRETAVLARSLDVPAAEKAGSALTKKLTGKIPLVYASTRNNSIAYTWKIKLNETGKIPAFSNVFPELNHNEMTGFDSVPESQELSERFHCIFLSDSDDHPRILKRMEITKELYEKRKLGAEMVPLQGADVWQKIFQSLLIADWAAFHTAEYYGADSEQVPMVEELKRLIS